MRGIFFTALLLVLPSTSSAIDIIVPGDYQTIQEGIDAAEANDRVVVSPGTWLERITLKDSVDVVSSQGAAVTIIDANSEGRAVVANSVAALFSGFTITGGTAPSNGGGMNVAGSGFELRIEGCVFTGNTADGRGGGLAVQVASALINDCVFDDNTASGGAGLYVTGTSLGPVRLEFCVFLDNTSAGPGGGVLNEDGFCELLATRIYGNSSNSLGGGVAADGGVTTISNCLVYANSASEGGGLSYHRSAVGTVESSVLYANSAALGGGLSCTSGSTPFIQKTIITGSTGSAMRCDAGSTPVVTCCDLFGNGGGDTICGTDAGSNIMLDPEFCHVDPLVEGKFPIQSDSPCAPDNAPCGELIGAEEPGCGVSSVQSATWGAIKASYR